MGGGTSTTRYTVTVTRGSKRVGGGVDMPLTVDGAQIGNLSNHEGDANEGFTQKTNFTFLNYFAIIPTSSICIRWPNYPGAEDGGQV